MPCDYLFVYGTLRRGTGNPMCRLLDQYARLIDHARYQGRMFRIAQYPGVVASDDPGDRVHGELHELIRPESLWPTLDSYEGCGPRDAEPFEFVRRPQPIVAADGSELQAWVYLYNRPTIGLRRIDSGDFLAG